MNRVYGILLCIVCPVMAYGQEKFEVNGAIVISDAESIGTAPGTIRWTGTDFEGWNGQRWVSFTGYATVGTVMDIEGNTYKTARIGDLEWMAENLRVTTYNDNTLIDQITSAAIWAGLTSGAWCWYDNKSAYDAIYGKLYNWYAVNTEKLCPDGWHVPNEAMLTNLANYLGGFDFAGGKMKTTGTTYWTTPNTEASNESGFCGLPGGYRTEFGNFDDIKDVGIWFINQGGGFAVTYNSKQLLGTPIPARYGASVRCVKNN